MRTTVLLSALILFGAAHARAQAPTALVNPVAPGDAPAALPAKPTEDQVLDALDVRGQSLREFNAKVSMTRGDPFVGDQTTRTGQAWFQKKGEDDGRIRVMFDKRKDGKVIKDEKLEYVFDEGWLTDRDYSKQSETRRQVLKPGEKMNLWKLGEGPFPLPIGQKKEEVRKLFDVAIIPPEKEDAADPIPPDSIHLQLTPKKGTRYKLRFKAIDVWVDRKTDFPAQIKTAAPDESDRHVTRLQDVQINPQGGLRDADLKLREMKLDQWNVHSEPYRD